MKRTINLGKHFLLSSLFAFSALLCSAQERIDFRSSQNNEIRDLETRFSFMNQEENLLINGIENDFQYEFADGHPYFRDNIWHDGTVVINSKEFKNVKLKLELLNNELLLLLFNPSGSHEIILNKSLVERFEINGSTFENLGKMNHSGNLEQDYVEVIFKGERLTYYLEREKYLEKQSASPPLKYVTKTRRYISKSGNFFRIRNKYVFFKLFRPYKKEIKQFLRENQISIRFGSDDQIAKVVEFCDELMNSK